MEYRKKEKLLERFWQGQTSELEEAQLYAYFNEDNENVESLEDKEYFNFIYHERNQNGLGLDFDQKVLSEIKKKKKRPLGIIMKIAASLALLFGLYTFMTSVEDPHNPIVEDTYEDPEKAYQEVKKALFLLSGEMNKSQGYTGELKKFSKAKKEIRTRKLIQEK